MGQRKALINEEPKEEVARREQSKEGMDGWMEWYGFRAQGIHINGEREKEELVLPSSGRDMGLYGALLQKSRRYF